jgi:hypothetical protein
MGIGRLGDFAHCSGCFLSVACRENWLGYSVTPPEYRAMAQPLPVAFVAGATGGWKIEKISSVVGEGLAAATHLTMIEGPTDAVGIWRLRGVTSYPRYSTANELKTLTAVSPLLGRAEARHAALIPIKKSDAWWTMGQDARRKVFEDSSQHIARSMKYLPAVARRLHHSRDLGEPFDFLTWFEYAPENAAAFEDLVAELRGSVEWRYVEREVDIRLTRG